MTDFPLTAYLSRIGWNGPVAATPEILVALHRHHVLAIPFENIDSFSGRPVSLDPEALVAKIIHGRRGGYCFEQNGLFLLALGAIGFRTRALCARVLVSEGHYAARTHQATLVEFDGAHWLADVGFGGNGLLEAIPFELECEFAQPLDRFRLVPDATFGFRLEHRLPRGWRTLYAFSLDPCLRADFDVLNYFICRAPESFFTRIPICVRITLAERRIVVANQFKVRTTGATTTATTIENAAHLRAILEEEFGLVLPAGLLLPDPPATPAGMREV